MLSEDEMLERIKFWIKDRNIEPLIILPDDITDEYGTFAAKVLVAGLPHDFDKFVINRNSGSYIYTPSNKLVHEVQRKLMLAENVNLEDEFNFVHIILMYATDITVDEVRTYMPEAIKGVLQRQSWYKTKFFKGRILEPDIKEKLREIKIDVGDEETTLADPYDISSVRILSMALAIRQSREYMNLNDVENSILLYRVMLRWIIDPINPKLATVIDPKLSKNELDKILKFTEIFDLRKLNNIDTSIAEISSRIGCYYADAKIDAKLRDIIKKNIELNKCIECGKETNKRCDICLAPICDNCIPLQIVRVYRRCKKHLDVESD